jgi:outer membrane protein assembly factor BamB
MIRPLLIVAILLLTTGDAARVLASAANPGFGGFLYELTPSEPSTFDEFGYSVAIDGGLALVASEDDDEIGISAGAAFLYEASTGQQLRKLTAEDGIAGDELGYSAALNASTSMGPVALLGSPRWLRNGDRTGAAYLFDADTGAQVARLNADDGLPGDQFGISVSLDGDLALVGARQESSIKEDSGAAYLFDVNTGQQLHKLKANDAGLNDQFGTSVDLDGNLAVVGAYLDDGGLGSAYLFDVSTGQQVTKLLPNDSLGRIQFGISVGIDNGVVIVGARGERPDGLFTGVAYLFDAATGTQLAQLYADDGSAFDNFGFAVAIDNGLALITAHEDNVHGSQSGSAYIFDVVTHQQLAQITAPRWRRRGSIRLVGGYRWFAAWKRRCPGWRSVRQGRGSSVGKRLPLRRVENP